MRLSNNFTLEELTFSQTATRKGINNVPPQYIINRLILTADKMEGVRKVCGNVPIFVSSGYRCELLNELIGGSKTSAHPKGYAIDFKVAGKSIREVIKLIENSDIRFDQLINEFNRWVHISFDPLNRHQVFSIGA